MKARMGSSFAGGLRSEVWGPGASDVACQAHLGGHLLPRRLRGLKGQCPSKKKEASPGLCQTPSGAQLLS